MKSKSLESRLATESGFSSEMVTRFQKLRDSKLLSRSRGRNAEFLDTDEIVSGILSMVGTKPGFAALTAGGLRKLKPVGVPEDAFAGAPTLAAALVATLEDSALRATVKEIRLGDSDPVRRMTTSASIHYMKGSQEIVSQYVPESALSLFHKGKEKEFDRHSLGKQSVMRETVLKRRLLDKIAREIAMTRVSKFAIPQITRRNAHEEG